jgi:hypothetical protein
MATIYLSNKELLREIHKSKNTFCSYTSPEDSNYDLILPSLDKINVRTLKQAREARADRLSALLKEKDKKYFVLVTNDMGHSFVSNFENYEMAMQYEETYIK